MKIKTETAYDLFLNNVSSEVLYMPEGTRLTLLKYTSGNDLFASSLLINELQRISIDEQSLAKERRGFESWVKYMKHIPKKPVCILMCQAMSDTFAELYFKMYGHTSDYSETENQWKKRCKVTNRFIGFLISRGLLRISCNINESEVSK